MFVDELKIYAKAGDGGNGVVRWLHAYALDHGGPAGGDGGRGGNVFIEGVRNLGLLSKYTGDKKFMAENGGDGREKNLFGKNGEDMIIKLPIGSKVTNLESGVVYFIEEVGQSIEILHGGNGGYGNSHFKSSTNQTPEEAIPGQKSPGADFLVELTLGVDVGLIGFPNAGKSTLLNTFTNATSAIGSYPFTTLEPHLGELYGYIFADVPGLIEGASEGKGLGHKFLKHTGRSKMLLHLVSLEDEDVVLSYDTIIGELEKFNPEFLQKDMWVVLTKSDVMTPEEANAAKKRLESHSGKPVFVISAPLEDGTKELQDALIEKLRAESI